MMKARADDRRIFESRTKPNILAFVDSQGMNANEIASALNAPINKDDVPKEYLFDELQEKKDGLFNKMALAEKKHVSQGDIGALIELFEHAKTFGSLIQIPPKLAAKLPEIKKRLDDVLKNGDLTHFPAQVFKPLLVQAGLLARQYHAVVANPPYMGGRYMNPSTKDFIRREYAGFHHDLFASFIRRSFSLISTCGELGFVVPFNWMFLATYDNLRSYLLSESVITTEVQLEFNAFEPAMVSVCLVTFQASHSDNYVGTYIRLSEFRGPENQSPKTLEAISNPTCRWRFHADQSEFNALPGKVIAYWIGERMRKCFAVGTPLGNIAEPRQGMATADNARFLRRWHETPVTTIGFAQNSREIALASRKKWFPYNKEEITAGGSETTNGL